MWVRRRFGTGRSDSRTSWVRRPRSSSDHARAGGGALPLLELEGPAVALITETDPVTLMRALREGEPPVIGRISDGRVLLDPRTLTDDDVSQLGAAVRAALGR